MGLRDLLSADQKCFEKEFSLQKNVGLMFSTLNLQFKTKHKKIAFRNLTEVAFQQVFDFLYPLNLKCVIAVLWMFIHRRPVKNRISLCRYHCILSYFWLGLLFSAGKYYFCQLSWIVRLSDVSLCYISSQHLTSQNNKMSSNISYAATRKENTHFRI